jgi:hypothetical protein
MVMGRRVRVNAGVALTTAALLAVTAGCGGGDGGKDHKNKKDDRAVACTHGTYAWSGIERGQKLTGLADPIRLKKRTDSVSVHVKPVKGVSYKPHMTSTAAGVRAADAIKALGRYLKTDEPLADPTESAEPAAAGSYIEQDSSDLKGAYYGWSYIDLVEADFTYTCAGGDAGPIKGHVLSWAANGSGFLSCGDPLRDGPDKAGSAERTAVRETCPPDSAAAKSA